MLTIHIHIRLLSSKNFCSENEEHSMSLILELMGMVYSEILLLPMSKEDFDVSLNKISMGRYELSPIKVVAIPRADYFCEITKVRPDAMLTWIFQLNEKPLLFLHHQDDIILIVALSNTIICLIYGALPDDEFPYECQALSFYARLASFRDVSILYKVYLKPSIFTIPNTRIIDKVKELAGNGIVTNSDFLKLTIYSSGEEIVYPTGRLSLAGKLTMALFDMVLMDFDHEFKDRFPGIECIRFIDEVYIAIKCGDRHMNEDELLKDILKFLNEMDIEGKIESTRAGEKSFSCFHDRRV